MYSEVPPVREVSSLVIAVAEEQRYIAVGDDPEQIIEHFLVLALVVDHVRSLAAPAIREWQSGQGAPRRSNRKMSAHGSNAEDF